MTLWEVVSRFCDNNVRSAILQSTQKSQKYIIGMFTIQLPNVEKDLLHFKTTRIRVMA